MLFDQDTLPLLFVVENSGNQRYQEYWAGGNTDQNDISQILRKYGCLQLQNFTDKKGMDHVLAIKIPRTCKTVILDIYTAI